MSARTKAAVVALVAVGVAWGGARQLGAGERGDAPLLVPATFSPGMASLPSTNRQIAFFTAAAERDPYGSIARAELAHLYLQRARETGDLEDQEEAERWARESLELRGAGNVKGYRMLAAALLARHHFTEAEETAGELVRMWPEEPSHRALLGQIQLELGHYAAAEETFAGLMRHEESLAVAPRLAAWAHIRGQPEEALRLLRLARDRAMHRTDLPAEQRAWYHLMVGQHELERGHLEEAEAAFASGLGHEPGDFRIVAALIRLEASRGEWARAIEYGERLGDAADLRTLGILGDAHAALGDSVAAGKLHEALERSAAESPEPFNRQLYAYRLDHGRAIPETLEVLQAEVERRPDVLGHHLLGHAMFLAGRTEEARESLRHALRMGTEEPLFHYHLGRVEHALGNDEEARHHLRESLRINPHFHHRFAPEARATVARLGG